MKVQTREAMNTQGVVTMLLDQLKGMEGFAKAAEGLSKETIPAGRLMERDAAVDSSKLGKLCAAKKEETAPKGTVREADELKQQQGVETAKLKQQQLGESKALHGKQEGQKKEFAEKQSKDLAGFEGHQKAVKDKFLAKKPSKDQIASFEKTQAEDKKLFASKQEAEKKTFDKGLVEENQKLYAKHQKETKALTAKHQKETQALEAKHAPIAKPATAPMFTVKMTGVDTLKGKTIIEEGYIKLSA